MRRLFQLSVMLSITLLGSSFALADIEIYGVAKISADVIDDGIETNIGMSSNQSYLGVKGGHQINERLKGIYQFEMGFDATGETGTFSARKRFVGFEGGLGRVLFGNHYTLFRVLERDFDLFHETIGDSRGILGLSAAGAIKYDRWASNSTTYFSPDFNGLNFMAQYSTAYKGAATASGSDDNDEQLRGLGVGYAAGAITLRGVYESHQDDHSDGVRLTLKYKFDKAVFGAVYETADAGSGDSINRDAYGANIAYPVRSYTLAAQVIKADDYEGATNSGATNISLGIFKELDEYLLLYIAYSATTNEANAKYTIASVGHNGDLISAVSPGDDIKAISLGAVYTFN